MVFCTCFIVMSLVSSHPSQTTSPKSPNYRASAKVMKAEIFSSSSSQWIKTMRKHQLLPRAVRVLYLPLKFQTSLTHQYLRMCSWMSNHLTGMTRPAVTKRRSSSPEPWVIRYLLRLMWWQVASNQPYCWQGQPMLAKWFPPHWSFMKCSSLSNLDICRRIPSGKNCFLKTNTTSCPFSMLTDPHL